MTDGEPFEFLRQTPLFRNLTDELLQKIFASGESLECGPGFVLFEEGEPGFDVYVVKSGVVEVLKQVEGSAEPKVVSYLAAGDILGEMSLVTGLLRSATVRVPQTAGIFRIPGNTFDALLKQHAEIALSLARTLAYRLQIANQVHTQTGGAKHLSGDLEFFDLAEVCQSLTQSRRTGLMRINTEVADQAWLYFKEGDIRHARVGDLTGSDAVMCVFRRPFKGSFEFQAVEGEDDLAGEPAIEDSAMHLLLESARQRDEVEELASRLPATGSVLEQAAPFPWTKLAPRTGDDMRSWHPASESELSLAHRIWAAIAVGLSLQTIRDEFIVHELEALKILNALMRGGAIRGSGART